MILNFSSRLPHRHRLALGGLLACSGSLSILLSALLDSPKVLGPWAFPTGFIMGLVTGIGAVLSVSGLTDRSARE